jgi:very-short-patch-repair endonuclease
MRAPQNRFRRLTEANRNGIELHWGRLLAPADGTEFRIGLVDALIQICRCQQPRFALASLDNALHLSLVSPSAIVQIFEALPTELQWLRCWVDPRSESGQETVLRFIVRLHGLQFEIQVAISGVGRVDMLIEGCLVVEADSRQFHDGWEAHLRDRTRDCDLAGMSYMSYRAIHRDIFYHPERVIAAITGLLAARNRYRVHVL